MGVVLKPIVSDTFSMFAIQLLDGKEWKTCVRRDLQFLFSAERPKCMQFVDSMLADLKKCYPDMQFPIRVVRINIPCDVVLEVNLK